MRREISRNRNLAFRRSFIGREVKGITLAKEEEMVDGVVLTENYIHARVAHQTVPPNHLVTIRIDEASAQVTRATIVDSGSVP